MNSQINHMPSLRRFSPLNPPTVTSTASNTTTGRDSTCGSTSCVFMTYGSNRSWNTLNTRLLGFFALLLALSAPTTSTSCWAEDKPQTGSAQAKETGLERTGVPSVRGLSISIADGLIRTIKGKRVARIALQWDYLPLDSQMLMDFATMKLIQGSGDNAQNPKNSQTFRLRPPQELTLMDTQFPTNSLPYPDPVDGPTTQDQLKEARSKVFRSLAKNEALNSAELALWHKLFEEFWTTPGNLGYESAAAGRISARQFYGLVRDHLLLVHIISGNAPRFILHLPITSDVYLPPRGASLWKFRAYTFEAGSGQNAVSFDRYTLALTPTPFDVELSDIADNTDIPLRASAIWESNNGIDPTSPLLGFNDIAFKFSAPPTAGELPKPPAPENPTGNWLEAILKMGGNTNLGDVTGKLFASKNSSVFAGAMISEGEVGRVVGLNYEKETSSSIRPGLSVGMDVTSSDKLNFFAGPSLSMKAIQLALGARLTSQEETKGHTSFKVRPAVALSFDMSEILGGKEKHKSMQVDKTKASYEWGKSSDEVFTTLSNLGAMALRVEWGSSGDPLQLNLQRVQIKDDKIIETTPNVRFAIPTDNREHFSFVPAGYYQFVLPANTSLYKKGSGQPIDTTSKDALLDVKSDGGPARLSLVLKRN